MGGLTAIVHNPLTQREAMTENTKQTVVDKIKKELEEEYAEKNKDSKHLERVITHIENVQKSCLKLSKRLMESEETYEVGFKLLKNSYLHDNSKFSGIEWKYLRTPDLIKEDACKDKEDQKKCFKLALEQHVKNNMHHPEYWGDIKLMPPEYVAEMVCDLNARSMEFGTDLRQWIKKELPERWGASSSTKAYREVMKYVNTLLDDTFKKGK